MAPLAVRRVTKSLMVGGGGSLIGSQMAAVAFRRKALPVKLPNSAGSMARIAVGHSVRPDQRKTILMRIDILQRYLPAANLVT